MVYVTDDEWVDFVGEERRRRTGPSQTPVTAPHPDYSYNTTSAYDWSEPDFQWADTLPDAGAGNDPFGYMDMGQIGLPPQDSYDLPSFWQRDPFEDLGSVGLPPVDSYRFEDPFADLGAVGLPPTDSYGAFHDVYTGGGLDTEQPLPAGRQWVPDSESATFDPYIYGSGYESELRAQRGTEDFLKEAGLSAMSGERTLGHLGIDTSGLPDEWYFPVRQAVDVAAAPATWLSAGLGGEVPVIGSTLGGAFATRLAGEAALGTLGTVAGQQAAEAYGESDLPGSNNPWAQAGVGLGAGVLAGAAGLKGIDMAPGLARGIEGYADDLTRSSALLGRAPNVDERLLYGAVDPQTGRPFDYAPIIGGALRADDDIAAIFRELDQEPAWERLQQLIAEDKGSPKVLFHGTREANLTELLPGEQTGNGTAHGLFFTDDPDIAGYYGDYQHTVHVTDSGMLDLRPSYSFANYARDILGLDGDELDDAVRWHEEGTLYNSYGSARLQNDVVDSAKNLGFRGVIFNDSTSQFGGHPSYVFFNAMQPDTGAMGGADLRLTRGAEVFDPETGKTLRVTRAFTGDETGVVVLKDQETGETVRRVRGELADPPPGAAVQALPGNTGGAAGPSALPEQPPVPPPPKPPTDIDMNEARRQLLDAAKREASIRKVGTADREIAEGRRIQAEGIRTRLAEGRAQGMKGKELTDYARGGMKVGPLRKTVTPALDLSPEVRESLLTELTVMHANRELRDFELITAARATQKLINGEGLQPAEIRLIRKTWGDEVADIVATRPKKINPAVEDLRIRRETERMAAQAQAAQQREATRELQRANREIAEAQELADRRAFRAKWKAIARQNEVEQKDIDYLNSLFITPEERAIGQREMMLRARREQTSAGLAAQRSFQKDLTANPDTETLRRKALAAIDGMDVTEEAKTIARATVQRWEEMQALTSRLVEGNDGPIARFIMDRIQGDLPDSYLSALLHRRAHLEQALKLTEEMDPDVARAVANAMTERELVMRFGREVPEDVRAILKQAKAPAPGERSLGASIAHVNQEWKNTQFGIGDFAVLGQQGLKDVISAWPSLMAGSVNRLLSVLHLPHIDTLTGVPLSKQIQYQLAGVAQNAATGAADLTSDGTLLRHVPLFGKRLDESVLVPATRAMTNLQFGRIMGTLRNINYEGNLAIAGLAKANVHDPAVQARAAAFANSATSFSPQALDANRANFEKAWMLSPSMRRAQVAQLAQVAKGLTTGSRTDRVLAASTILAYAGSLLAIGKVTNDYFGLEPFEFDPSKPGFGRITLPNPGGGRPLSVDVFPQMQVAKYVAQALRAVAEDPQGGWDEAGRAVAKLGMGSASSFVQLNLHAMGAGFDPVQGRFTFGDYGKGGFKQGLLTNSPIPPVAIDAGLGTKSYIEQAFSFAGLNASEEAASQTYDRQWRDAALFKGRKWGDLTSDEKAALERQYGPRPNSSNPEFARSQQDSDRIKAERQAAEAKAGAEYEAALAKAATEAEKRDAGRRYREELGRIQDYTNGQFAQWAQGKDFGPQNPLDAARTAYFDTFKAATANGVLDEEKQQALLAKLEASWTPEQKAYVEAAIGRKRESADPTLQGLYDAQAAIRESGYYDLTEGKAKWRQAHPEIDALLRKYGYGETTTKAMDIDARLNAEQKADDLKLRAANFSEAETKSYRKRYDERETARGAAKDVLYGDLPPRERDALSMYYSVVKGMTAANGEIDWGGVDRWLSTAPKDVQNAVANRPDNAATPMVREMKRDQRDIGDSGYWDVADAAASQFTNGQYNSMNKLRQDVYNAAYEQARGQGLTELQAKVLAETMTTDYFADVDEMVSNWRTNFRRQPENAEIVKKLIKWGYWTPGKKDSIAIAGQPGLNW